MKRFAVILFVLLVPFCFSQAAFSADQVKVAIVDMAKFQQKSIAFQKIRNELRSKLQALQDKLDSEKTSLIKLEEELQKQSMMLSLDAKESKQQELEKKRRYYKYLYDELSIEMKGAEAEATKAVAKEINKVVDRIGKGSGYTIIFEKNMPGLVYFDDAIDITDEVIKSYDRSKK